MLRHFAFALTLCLCSGAVAAQHASSKGTLVGKPILGYRGDFRLSADNEGCSVNLQVEYFIRRSGGEIITRFADFSRALAKIGVVSRKRSD